MKKPSFDPLGIVGGWFRKDTEEPKPKPKPKPKRKVKREQETVPSTAPVTDTIAEMETALTRMEQDGTAAIAGRVQVLRFDQLREELGDKWEELGDRIAMVIENSISQHLMAKDMQWQLGEHAYVLVFTSVTPLEAEIKCGLIKAQVEEFFKGTPQLAGKITIETAVAAVDGSIRLESIADLETLYSQLNLSQADESNDEKTIGDEEPDSAIDLDDEDPQQVKVKWTAAADDIDAARIAVREIEYREQVVWNTSKRKFSGLAVTPQDPKPGGTGRAGSVLLGWSGGAMTCALDESTLERVRLIQAERHLPDTCAVWFQTHYGSYDRQKFRSLLTTCWNNLDHAQSGARVMEIIGLPKKRDVHLNLDHFATLSRYIGDMAICMDLVSPQVSLLKRRNVKWVGFTMRDTRLEEGDAVEAIANFTSLADKHGVRTYAREIPTENLATAAMSFGIQHILGNPSETPVDIEQGTYRVENLYG